MVVVPPTARGYAFNAGTRGSCALWFSMTLLIGREHDVISSVVA